MIHLIHQPTPAQLTALQSIYLESFPPAERIPFGELIESADRGERILYGDCGEAGLVGMAVVAPLAESGWRLLEYLATAHSNRGKGVGAGLLQRAIADARAGGAVGLLLEVEPPDSQDVNTTRRIEFYRRQGALPLGCVPAYAIPNLDQGIGAVEMQLLWIPTGQGEAAVTTGSVQEAIRAIYRLCYRRTDGDPLLSSVLRSVRCPE